MEKYCGFETLAELREDTERLFREALEVPNSSLPERYRGKRPTQSLESIHQKTLKFEKRDRLDDQEHAMEVARRVELYRIQAESGPIEFESWATPTASFEKARRRGEKKSL